MNADGTNQVQLTHDTVPDRHPKWSPDGTKIAFESYRGNWEIYVINADGTAETRLTNDSAYDFEPDWKPDGTKIAWRTGRFDGVGDIATMNPDGTGIVNLTNDPAYDREPGWSPDGTKIVYASVQGSNFDIRVMNADGTGKVWITTNPASDYDPDWAAGTSTPAFTLTVTKKGTGTGTVGSSPAGIACGTDCSQSYPSGTVVTLRARPATRSVFTGWGGACSGTGTCLVTMDAPKTATATFSPA
jgi:dipeptidyl aminopeptidase/acylaminoacyl peptidase